MAPTYDLFHGSPADRIIAIVNAGDMRPDPSGRIFFSERFEDALHRGTDLKKSASFVFKAQVTVPEGVSVERVSTPGNPLAVVLRTMLPVPVSLQELYVRTGRVGQFELNVIKGIVAIKTYLREK